MSCSNSYKFTSPECPEAIVVAAGLTPETNYIWVMKDIHDNVYSNAVTTDTDGTFTIDATDEQFPVGLFNRHAGGFTIEVFEDWPYNPDSEVLEFCATEYDSILLYFTGYAGNADASTTYIKCIS